MRVEGVASNGTCDLGEIIIIVMISVNHRPSVVTIIVALARRGMCLCLDYVMVTMTSMLECLLRRRRTIVAGTDVNLADLLLNFPLKIHIIGMAGIDMGLGILCMLVLKHLEDVVDAIAIDRLVTSVVALFSAAVPSTCASTMTGTPARANTALSMHFLNAVEASTVSGHRWVLS